MSFTFTDEKPWSLVRTALAIPLPLGVACAVSGLLVLCGYFAHVQVLYRPIVGGPATHPLTALAFLLLGLAVTAQRWTLRRAWLARVAAMFVIWICTSRLAEVVLGIDLTSWVTPFHAQALLENKLPGGDAMGVNTALMLLSIALSLEMFSAKSPRLSQLTAFAGIAIPSVGFIGFGYGLRHFYGQMSLLTASIGLGLAIATLAMTADRGALKAVFSPYLSGRIARLQVLAGFLIPTALGYLLVRSDVSGLAEDKSVFGIFVVTICWFIILMSSIAAAFHESVDFARRQGEQELLAAARTDSLTGLANRRRFFSVGEREVERIKRTGSELWVLMVDLDHFKHINDIAGHAIGDRILVAVADLLTRSVRKVDLVARFGGEEFAVLLTDTHRAGCARVAESIRKNIELLKVPEWTALHGPITASVGCAMLTPSGTLHDALSAADKALYVAKNSGRNTVAWHVEPDPLLA